MLKIFTSSESVDFADFRYDSDTNSFVSVGSSNVSLSLSTPIQLEPTFEGKEFEVFLLAKKDLRESEIFQVYDHQRKVRMGWCIPINALDSIDHDYADDVHFRRYAYVGIKTALNTIAAYENLSSSAISRGQIRITEVFPQSTALLIISKDNLDKPFTLDSWLPGLATFGLFAVNIAESENIYISRPRISSGRINLTPVAPNLNGEAYIGAIYKTTLATEKNEALRFFYLYQVIELLMEHIFRNEQSKIVQSILQVQHDPSLTKDVLEKANQNSSEKRRINLLGSSYTKGCGSANELFSRCNQMLRLLERDDGNDLSSTLYSIRNFLFHQFRNLPANSNEALASLNDTLLDYVSELLVSFKNPAQE